MRRLRTLALAALVLAVATIAADGSSPRGASATPTAQVLSPRQRPQIEAAFAHFFSPSVSTARVRNVVEAGSAPLAASLRKAASGFLGDFTQGRARMTVRTTTIAPVRRNVARVAFQLIVDYRSGQYAQDFTGAAVRVAGRWRVAWATACYVAESHQTSCPRPPARITELPLPEAQLPARFARPTALGLIRPEALAAAADGSLLIVDADRNQVLRRLPDGRLRVLAGTGELGFGGDRGPAADAKLSGPSALAIAADGSVYLADTDNGRVRVIATDGTIRSLAGHFNQPSGLAAARDGSLYVATVRSVIRVRPSGTRTVFAVGRGRFDQVMVGGHRYGGFSPSYLALDQAGDLYAFSFGTKTIFEFSPTGKPLHAWQDYADGLATAPDGSIIVAEHGTALQRLRHGHPTTIFDFHKNTLSGYPQPGSFAGSFDPDGVAVAGDGTIYTDTFVGNGWTNQTALAEITPSGHGQLLRTTSPLTQTLPPLGANPFPTTRYPPPRTTPIGTDPTACPSPRGLRPFSPRARAAAIDAARRIDVSPLWNGLRLSDRAWWPGLYRDQIDGLYEGGRHRVISVGPAAADPYAAAVARACGNTLLDRSLAIVIGHGVYSDQVSHLYFLDRNQHALLYWQHT